MRIMAYFWTTEDADLFRTFKVENTLGPLDISSDMLLCLLHLTERIKAIVHNHYDNSITDVEINVTNN